MDDIGLFMVADASNVEEGEKTRYTLDRKLRRLGEQKLLDPI